MLLIKVLLLERRRTCNWHIFGDGLVLKFNNYGLRSYIFQPRLGNSFHICMIHVVGNKVDGVGMEEEKSLSSSSSEFT